MTTHFNAVIYLNATSRFQPYSTGDTLVYDSRCILLLRSETVEDALEAAFTVGNRMAADAMGAYWSSDVRSVSVGDVVNVVAMLSDGTADDEGSYSVERFGWVALDEKPDAEYGEDAMVRLGVARRVQVA